MADAGYDSVQNVKYLLNNNIMPYITENPRGRKNPIDRGVVEITPEGKLLCSAGIELCYWGREHKRGRVKFRCGLFKQKGQGCLFRQCCYSKSEYGPTFYFKEDKDIQNVMKAILGKKTFKKTYKSRTVIEKVFNVLKGVHKLCELRFKGIRKVSSNVFMSLSAYLSRVIAGLKVGVELIAV
nr:transposase [Thermodesulfovibrio sp.]